MSDMIPVEAAIGYDDEGAYWVRMIDVEEGLEIFTEGPFETREDAERWTVNYMESMGGICMGSTDDTIH